MRLKQEFYRLPFRFDAERLAAEALSFPETAWRAHPSGYEGNTALILVSAHGGQNDDLTGPMQPTAVQLPAVRTARLPALRPRGITVGLALRPRPARAV